MQPYTTVALFALPLALALVVYLALALHSRGDELAVARQGRDRAEAALRREEYLFESLKARSDRFAAELREVRGELLKARKVNRRLRRRLELMAASEAVPSGDEAMQDGSMPASVLAAIKRAPVGGVVERERLARYAQIELVALGWKPEDGDDTAARAVAALIVHGERGPEGDGAEDD